MRRLAMALLMLLAACEDPGERQVVQGHVEAEEVLVAAPQEGWLAAVHVREGQRVARRALLFELDATRERAQRDAAASRLAQARATLEDLRKGERPQEIARLEAQHEAAVAELDFARSEAERQERLVRTSAGDRRSREQAVMQRDAAQARVEELQAALAVARLPARSDRIDAQQAAVHELEAALAEAEWRLAERSVTSRVEGRVEELVRHAGEFAPSGGAVLRLLPPGALKVRFFVPEARLSHLEPGQSVTVRCDACPAPVSAEIGFIASDAEFTPPVIYSVEARQKLVWLVEARLPAGSGLRPGQPVDVELPGELAVEKAGP
ncbi:HlyD family efflux transporter periplasmic adaptor subunit [Geminicoccaceae bacterium 1502E]|nr:HlyD family efflux transporter periplasmic adaptor subunit [Geminicoccaceae bacterium 1502E]